MFVRAELAINALPIILQQTDRPQQGGAHMYCTLFSMLQPAGSVPVSWLASR